MAPLQRRRLRRAASSGSTVDSVTNSGKTIGADLVHQMARCMHPGATDFLERGSKGLPPKTSRPLQGENVWNRSPCKPNECFKCILCTAPHTWGLAILHRLPQESTGEQKLHGAVPANSAAEHCGLSHLQDLVLVIEGLDS